MLPTFSCSTSPAVAYTMAKTSVTMPVAVRLPTPTAISRLNQECFSVAVSNASAIYRDDLEIDRLAQPQEIVVRTHPRVRRRLAA